MNERFLINKFNALIFDAVCERAANGYNDLVQTAENLLKVRDKLFDKETIMGSIHTYSVRTPPPPRDPIPPGLFKCSDK